MAKLRDCTEFEETIYELTMVVADENPGKDFDTIASIVAGLANTSEGMVLDSIVAATEGANRIVSEGQKTKAMMRQEAKGRHSTSKQRKALSEAQDAYEKAWDNAVDAVKREPGETRTLSEIQGETKSLKKETQRLLREAKRKLMAEMRKSEPYLMEKYQKQLEENIRRLEDQDYALPVPREELPISHDLRNLKTKVELSKRSINAKIQDMKPKSPFDHTINWMNFSRAVITSLDYSALMRQGGFVAMSHPILAAKNIPKMIKAGWSDEQALRIEQEVDARESRGFMDRTGLYLSDPESMSTKEELYMTTLIDKMPWWLGGGAIRGSARAYTTMLNLLRADVFDAMTQGLALDGNATLKEGEDIARFINIATGRGNWKKMAGAWQVLNGIFFAPRYVLSRFQLLAATPLWGANTNHGRKLIAMEYAKTISAMAAMYTLTAMAFADDEDDWFGLTFDWTSSDMGKLRFGNTRVDPMFGVSQSAVIIGRVITGKRTNQFGEVTDMREGGFGVKGVADTIASFARTKLSPAVSNPVDWLDGKDVVGNPVTLPYWMGGATPEEDASIIEHYGGTAIPNMAIPLSLGDIWDGVEEQGVAGGMALSLLATFGAGVQTYGDRATDKVKNAEKKKAKHRAMLKRIYSNPPESKRAGDANYRESYDKWREGVQEARLYFETLRTSA